MVKILVSHRTNRLDYSFKLLFSDILSIEHSVTSDLEEYFSYDGPRFVYGAEKVEEEIFIQNTSLLFETGIKNHTPKVSDWNDLKIFFDTSEESAIPFDLFAASFYLVSRYEEYLPAKSDKHGRFRSRHSLASQNGFLKRPMVNLYAQLLKDVLLAKFPQLHFPEQQSTLKVTIDIDNAYAFRYKGLGRTVGALAKKLLKFKLKEFWGQLACLLRMKRDPYDSYDKQFSLQKKYNIRPIYFFLLGDFGKHDRNLSHRNRHMKRLIKRVGQNANIGMHPSYGSWDNADQIEVEKQRLEHISGGEVTRSRHHYIRLRIPESYRQLISKGIKEDYSMGFPCRVGFRASVCTPFDFYDIENETHTSLRLYPFFAMDTTLRRYERVRSGDALKFLRPLISEIKSVNGEICFILHNESIGGQGKWRKWDNFYEEMVKLSLAS